jgi:hypothetical protein
MKACRLLNEKRCSEDGTPSSCNYSKPSKYFGTRKACRWLKRNPVISTTKDITADKIRKRADKLQRNDPEFMSRFIDANVCEQHTNEFLDIVDVLYLFDKHQKDTRHAVYTPRCGLTKEYNDEDFTIVWNAKKENGKGSLLFPNGFLKRLKEYSSKTWVAILVYIKSDHDKEGHSNVIFYYPKTKTAERVEASGYRFPYYDQKEFDRRLKYAFKNWGITYTETIDLLPRQGPASIAVQEESAFDDYDPDDDPSGFCQTWSYFMIDQRYKNPTLPLDKLFQTIIKRVQSSNHTFLELIRSFHGVVQRARPALLKKIGYDEDEDVEEFFYEHYNDIAAEFDLC